MFLVAVRTPPQKVSVTFCGGLVENPLIDFNQKVSLKIQPNSSQGAVPTLRHDAPLHQVLSCPACDLREGGREGGREGERLREEGPRLSFS